jgi:hypothetical protein
VTGDAGWNMCAARVLDTPGRGCHADWPMLRWFRSRARSIAAAALVSLATLTVWSAAPHGDDCHDAVCVSIEVPHDPSAHSISRGSTTEERPLHCVLCHWTRIVRPSTATAHHIAPAVERDVRIPVDLVCAPQFFSAAQPPLRAPPTSSLNA